MAIFVYYIGVPVLLLCKSQVTLPVGRGFFEFSFKHFSNFPTGFKVLILLLCTFSYIHYQGRTVDRNKCHCR